MDAKEVWFAASSDEKITFMAETYGDDFPVIFVDGILGHEDLSEFRMTEDSVSSNFVSFGVRKHSPLLEPITDATLRILEVHYFEIFKYNIKHKNNNK